jgi:hypothetical protein
MLSPTAGLRAGLAPLTLVSLGSLATIAAALCGLVAPTGPRRTNGVGVESPPLDLVSLGCCSRASDPHAREEAAPSLIVPYGP